MRLKEKSLKAYSKARRMGGDLEDKFGTRGREAEKTKSNRVFFFFFLRKKSNKLEG